MRNWRACAPRPTRTAMAGPRSGSRRRSPGASGWPNARQTGGSSVDVVHRLSWTGRTQERSELEWTGPALVGVLNVTPDSFSAGGSLDSVEDAVAVGVGMAEAGALFVDVGGESTRPGAAPVMESEELARVLPVVEGLSARGVRVSIDSRHAAVAEAALAAGAAVVNDVSGLRDAEMIAVCAAAGVPVVIVHMQGDPQTMQLGPTYED